jgi:hypothetical protein
MIPEGENALGSYAKMIGFPACKDRKKDWIQDSKESKKGQ